MAKNKLTVILAAMAAIALTVSSATAAVIEWDINGSQPVTWNSTTAGAADVLTSGETFSVDNGLTFFTTEKMIWAVNLSHPDCELYSDLNPVIDGVQFTAYNPWDSRDIQPLLSDHGGTSGDTDYDVLIGTLSKSNSTTIETLTIPGLTVGKNYVVQVWYIDSRQTTRTMTFDGTNPMVLMGGNWEFGNGIFTADADTQVLSLDTSGTGKIHLNAVQVREYIVPVTMCLTTDFAGRTVNGSTAGTITWTTNGVSDPGDLTAVDVNGTGNLAGLFTTDDADGHFGPNLNVDNEGPWAVTVPLTLTVPEMPLANVVLDYQHFDNSGSFQTANRIVEWTVTVTGSISGQLGSVTVTGASSTSGTEAILFDPMLTLTSDESYGITIQAEGKTSGNNTGLAGLTLNDESANLIAPTVDAGNDWITWSGEPVTADANVVNNSDSQWPLTYDWSVEPADGDANLEISIINPDQEDATIAITKICPTGDKTTVTMILAANNEGSGSDDIIDTMTIDVYDNACLAAKAAGQAMIDSTDFNADCVTDFYDFIELASAWLDDYSLPGSLVQ